MLLFIIEGKRPALSSASRQVQHGVLKPLRFATHPDDEKKQIASGQSQQTRPHKERNFQIPDFDEEGNEVADHDGQPHVLPIAGDQTGFDDWQIDFGSDWSGSHR